MATAYSVQDWTELFVASAGASAALTGLLFVAVSVNIDRILAGSVNAWVLLVEILR